VLVLEDFVVFLDLDSRFFIRTAGETSFNWSRFRLICLIVSVRYYAILIHFHSLCYESRRTVHMLARSHLTKYITYVHIIELSPTRFSQTTHHAPYSRMLPSVSDLRERVWTHPYICPMFVKSKSVSRLISSSDSSNRSLCLVGRSSI
jgi:hypothetical protein